MSDRVFALVIILVALAYIASAIQLQTSFLSDPVGTKTFPILVGSVAVLCGGVIFFRPAEEPQWPGLRTLMSLGFSLLVLIAFALSLKPAGFLIPTAIAAGLLSYQIKPSPVVSAVIGVGLSVGLFVIFKYLLGLGLQPFPKGWV